MLKIKAYANAQPIKYNSKNKATLDGWGLPRQTIYLNESRRRYDKLVDYSNVAKHQTDFMDMVEGIIIKYPSWADTNNWGYAKMPKMYNDPVQYSMNDLIKETKDHYKDAHDPTLSMLLRQKHLIRKLSQDLADPSIVDYWDIDISFKNPHEPALKKFYDRGILKTISKGGNSFNDLFGE